KGGLLNCYSVTPEYLVKVLNGKYHKVFNHSLEFLNDSDKEMIDKLFKDLFEFIAIDICKLSDIADEWKGRISNVEDFIELFFENLPSWGLPAKKLELPTQKIISSRKNCLRNSYNFIH